MTPTDEDLLALISLLDNEGGTDRQYVREAKIVLAGERRTCADALRAIVAERQAMHLETCPSCSGSGMALDDGGDPGLCHECKGDTVVVRETPVCERQPDLLPASERQAIRDQALEDAAQCCAAEADRCDGAVKWGGHRTYIQNCKAAAYAMRNRAAAIRKMKGREGMTGIEAYWEDEKMSEMVTLRHYDCEVDAVWTIDQEADDSLQIVYERDGLPNNEGKENF